MIFMLRSIKQASLALAIIGAVNSASAFSMLGPVEAFQIERIGYNIQPPIFADIGGPMNLGEEYRFNLRTIYFGFDSSFKNYFGTNGMGEIRKAMAILNNLPPFSKMSANLAEFETDTRRVNFRASALGLIDLKSWALGAMMEELGLASPERYVWCLFARIEPPPIDYNVIKRNFDPVTLTPSSYVNDTLYTYTIREFNPARPIADAVEIPVDPLAPQFTAVASTIDSWLTFTLLSGDFFSGLTRDDVGGLRYLYSGKGPYVNFNVENLIVDAITNGLGSGGVWTPAGAGATVGMALRPGIDRIVLKEAKYDSTLGLFVAFTNNYKDTYVQNSRSLKQTYQRPIIQPDIIFGAADLGASVIGRSGLTNWVNNSILNSQVALAGPGVIQTPVFIIFNKTGPFLLNVAPDALDEATAGIQVRWGSFDGTTNEPVIYPVGTSIQAVEDQVLRGH
jgi:hypothetical protein